MPIYSFECNQCNTCFEDLFSYSDYDAGFPDVGCPQCKSKDIEKNILTKAPGVMFSDPKSSSKWDNWYYRQGYTAEKAKMERAAAEAAAGHKPAYRNIDDTNGGRKMNFID